MKSRVSEAPSTFASTKDWLIFSSNGERKFNNYELKGKSTSNGSLMSGDAALMQPNKSPTLAVFRNLRTSLEPSGSPGNS